MNLATLERMVREGDMSRDAFTYLLNCRAECEWLDYKEQLRLESDKELCAFARDIVALKNVGGGFILVGVKDKTWDQVGLPEPLPYDAKMLRDKVVRATGLTLDVDIVQHDLTYDRRSLPFALIHIRASKKRSKRRRPTLVAKDFCRSQAFGLRRGEIYVRRGDSTILIDSQSDLEDLLRHPLRVQNALP
jgi:predicted HTH transcriptional regulator